MENIAKFHLVLAVIAFPFFAPLSPGAERVDAMLQRALPAAPRGETRLLISQAYAQHHPGHEVDAHRPDSHGSGNTGSPGAAPSATSASTATALDHSRTVGDYALDFLVPSRLRAGEEESLAVTVTDRTSGTPARGLPVELVLVHITTPSNHGGHGVAEAADHAADKNQAGGAYQTVTPLPLIEDEHRPGYYETKHAFQEAGSHVVLIKLRPDLREYAALSLLVEVTGGHPAGGAGPNYLFISFLLSTVAVTILMVAILRQREQSERIGEVR
jgi:hypothetical protein